MTFQPLLFAPADEFDDSIDDGGAVTLSAAVAVSDDQMRVVTVDASLIPMQATAGAYEFAYSIRVVSLDDSIPAFETQDRTVAKAYIPEESHPYVLPTVVNAMQRLVLDIQPASIYRVTKLPNLPVPAMRKHELLTSLLEDMGYMVGESGTDAFGRRFWNMERN